ncbi:MAG: hypothetical protein WDN44_06235 [Sphingomonas sp.]
MVEAHAQAPDRRRLPRPVTPEPLPPDHLLWTAPNAILTMHLSGRSQTRMITPRTGAVPRESEGVPCGRAAQERSRSGAGY